VTLSVHPDLAVAVQNVSTNKAYEAVDLAVGARQYIDRDYAIASYSLLLEGGTLIRTANDDKGVTAAAHLTLSTAEPTTVYVGFDRRNAVRPAWLSAANGWTPSEQTIRTDYAAGNPSYIVYSKNFAAGSIVLGGPGQGPPLASGSHYVVVLTAQRPSGDITGDGVANRADIAVLLQNYGRSSAATRAQGDLNGDGAVNLRDLALVQSSLAIETPSPAASVVANARATRAVARRRADASMRPAISIDAAASDAALVVGWVERSEAHRWRRLR
jgi:hypothetical protein